VQAMLIQKRPGRGRLPEHSSQAAPEPFPFRHENDTHVDVNRRRQLLWVVVRWVGCPCSDS